MVFHLSDKQMMDSSQSSSGRKKRGGFRRRKFSGRKLGEGERPPSSESVEGPAEPSATPEAAPVSEHVYSDERAKRAGRNARLRTLSYPVAIGAGAAVLFGGMGFGLESWVAAIAASVVATVAYKVVDSRIR